MCVRTPLDVKSKRFSPLKEVSLTESLWRCAIVLRLCAKAEVCDASVSEIEMLSAEGGDAKPLFVGCISGRIVIPAFTPSILCAASTTSAVTARNSVLDIVFWLHPATRNTAATARLTTIRAPLGDSDLDCGLLLRIARRSAVAFAPFAAVLRVASHLTLDFIFWPQLGRSTSSAPRRRKLCSQRPVTWQHLCGFLFRCGASLQDFDGLFHDWIVWRRTRY